MLKLNNKFNAKWDGKQWVLYETYMGRAGMKDGKPTEPSEQIRESYHGTLRQACKKVIDASTADCGDAKAIMAVMEKAGWVLEGKASGYLF